MDKRFQNPHLAGDSLFFKGSRTGVLLIHGFTATTVEVRPLANYFISEGCTVIAPLLPGHGTTPEDLNRQKYRDWTNCVEENYLRISSECDYVIVGGESMGGVLSLFLAEKYSDIYALLLFSTALSVRRLKYAKLLKYYSPIIDKGLPDDNLPWQGYTVYPLWAADQFLRLTRKVKKNLYKVKSPALILQGSNDTSIDTENIQTIFDSIGSEIKLKIMMKKSRHVMLLDREFDAIVKNVQTFLAKLENHC